jgi:hypothetical protein
MNEQNWRAARARLASLVGQHAPQEQIDQARAEFRALVTEDKIARLIAQAPELSREQRARLAGLLITPEVVTRIMDGGGQS